jgi:hypothetical protein
MASLEADFVRHRVIFLTVDFKLGKSISTARKRTTYQDLVKWLVDILVYFSEHSCRTQRSAVNSRLISCRRFINNLMTHSNYKTSPVS